MCGELDHFELHLIDDNGKTMIIIAFYSSDFNFFVIALIQTAVAVDGGIGDRSSCWFLFNELSEGHSAQNK